MPQPDRPIVGTDDGCLLNLTDDERELLRQLMGELESLLGEDDHPYLTRLFPVAYPDDDEAEAEYQRLMRDDLVTSRLTAIGTVTDLLGEPNDHVLTEEQVVALMQSLNAIRLVLGSILGISTDEDAERVDDGDTAGHHLYGYLSWLLEWTVQSLSSV